MKTTTTIVKTSILLLFADSVHTIQLSEESSAEATSNNLLPAPNFSYQDRKYSGNKNVLKDM